MKLILKLIAGILFGLIIGLFAPDLIVRLMLTIKDVVGQLITFTIPMIIFFYIACGIACLPSGSGNLLSKTVGLAYGSTIIAGVIAFAVASLVLGGVLTEGAMEAASDGTSLTGFLTMEIPAVMPVMTALVLAFVFGIGISATSATSLRHIMEQARDIIEKLLSNLIIPALPFYIAGVFAEMAHQGTAFTILQTFGLVMLLAISMHWVWLTLLYVATGILLGKPVFSLLRNMVPAYLTALGTMSSAATIPVSLKCTKDNKVRAPIANFVIPLCASIHLSGSTITIVTCTTAVAILSPQIADLTVSSMLPYVLMLGVTMVAAPGAPGGAVMAALGLLATMLGFDESALALMIALYLAQDSFGTATNVTGDGVIAIWVDRFAGEQLLEETPHDPEQEAVM